MDALLDAIKTRQPDIRCLVLARSSVRYEQLLIEGVDAVILRNGSAQDLQDALSRLAQDTIDQQT